MAVLVMAVGTGVAITMFAFVNGVLWSSLNLNKGNEVLNIQWTEGDKVRNRRQINPEDFEVLKEESQSFEGMIAFSWRSMSFYNASGDSPAKQYKAARVSDDFFDAIGEKPVVGRPFRPDDVSRSQDDTIIISNTVWQEQFGGDLEAIGSMVMVEGRPYTVVGIARPGFRFPDEVDIWAATAWQDVKAEGRTFWLKAFVIGILKEGATIEQAKAELDTIAGRLAQEYPETNENLVAVEMKQFTRWYAGSRFESVSYALLFCSILVLGVACANVFNLIMTRTAKRTSELSVRSALGASRGHIVFQVLMDGVILTVLGGIGGVLIASWGLKLIWERFQGGWSVPYWWHMDLDGRVLGFVIGVVFVSALLSGLIPGLRASRSSMAEALKDDTRTSSGLFIGVLSKVILGFQITVAGVLAFVSIMMLIVWIHSQSDNLPFEPESVLNAPVNMRGVSEKEDESVSIYFVERMQERLEAYPGIESVAVSTSYGGLYGFNRPFEIEGEVYETEESKPMAGPSIVSAGFEEVFEAEPLVGRGFNGFDTPDSQLVCLVNKSLVDYHWPNEDPIGKRIKVLGFQPGGTDFRTIVGVLPDLREAPPPGEDLSSGSYFKVYMPNSQSVRTQYNILLRAEGDPRKWIETMRRELQAIAPQLAFSGSILTIRETMDRSRIIGDIIYSMFGVFGIASLVLGVVGLYAVMSFTTRQRYRELGIRMSLGANAKEIIMTVVKRGAMLLAIGGVLGIAIGHAVSMTLQRTVGIGDLRLGYTYPAVVVVLLIGAILSMGIPAWRASRISPCKALRID